MEEKDTIVVEQFDENGFSRRELLKRTAVVGVGVSALGAMGVEVASASTDKLDKITWISPRGTLNVMDDYNLVVPIQMGYFRKLGLDVRLTGGPLEGTATTKFVAQHLADMGYPSPGILTFSIGSGIPVYSVWEQYPSLVFDFALPAKTKITSPKQLAGKKIALGSIAWKAIVDPILSEVGVNPKTVKYVELGPEWTQATALGQADAALVWEGLRGQLIGQSGGFGSGISLKYLIGSKFSKGPSNTYAIRKTDLDDAHKKDVYARFFKGVVMGQEFGRANPRAASQITYNAYPALQALISPQVALESMAELASGYAVEARKGKGWGYHDTVAWQRYLDIVFKLGQTKQHFKVSDVLTNEFVGPANAGADKAKARRDAKAYKLDKYFAATKVPKYPL
jgi:NitT/TauT family transport system substrate-binding protein